MELQAARHILDSLVQGIHPVTGERMPEDSPYHAPPVVRALVAVSRALDGASPPQDAKPRHPQPPNAGKPWAAPEDGKLESAFAAGIDVKQIAQELGRTPFAIESRLVRLGKLPPKPGMRLTKSLQ